MKTSTRSFRSISASGARSGCAQRADLLGVELPVGYWLLRGQSETLKLSALAFTAGILLIAAVEDMLQEAHEAAEDTRLSAGFFIGGFALFTLVASYF